MGYTNNTDNPDCIGSSLCAVNSLSPSSLLPQSHRRRRFTYDYMNRRVQKRVVKNSSETYSRRYVYRGWHVIAEYEAPGGTSISTLHRTYAWGLDVAGSRTATGGVGALLQIHDHNGGDSGDYLAAYDGNGNLMGLYNAANGDEEAVYDGARQCGDGQSERLARRAEETGARWATTKQYSPFGELIRATGDYAEENPFRFSTKFTDDDVARQREDGEAAGFAPAFVGVEAAGARWAMPKQTGLIYYGHRYFSSALGRFINRDPIGEDGGLNLYGFVGNDPISGIDVLGQNGVSVGLGILDFLFPDWADSFLPSFEFPFGSLQWELWAAVGRNERDRKIRERKAETDAAAEANRARLRELDRPTYSLDQILQRSVRGLLGSVRGLLGTGVC